MKKLLLSLIFLTLTGCLKISIGSDNPDNPPSGDSGGCPTEPTAILTANNTETIVLTDQPLPKSGQVSAKKMVGYTFEAEAGQKLSFSTEDDICTWLYAPDTKLITNNELTQKGKYILQIGTIKGSKSFNLTMNFTSNNVASTNTNTPTNTSPPPSNSTPTNTPTITNTPPLNSAPTNSLTENEAVSIVQGWYDAKPNVFGGSFSRSLVAQYTTGQLYYETLQKPEEGSSGGVGWLQDRGCYYTYDFSNIEQVWSFDSSASRPYLKIKIYEGLQLHGPSQHGCGSAFHSYRKNATYWFEKDNGTWKIYDYEVE